MFLPRLRRRERRQRERMHARAQFVRQRLIDLPLPLDAGDALEAHGDEAGYRVPRSRENLHEHIWLCLVHAREHNESWDYFRGMTERQIESFRHEAVIGHRPTWPLGKRTARMHNPYGSFHYDDAFGTL